jgi:hypothetical protein
VPHGLENVLLVAAEGIRINPHKYRLKKGDPLQPVNGPIQLGTVIEDLTIEIVAPEEKKGEEKKGEEKKEGNEKKD